jgi:hypothetical protein
MIERKRLSLGVACGTPASQHTPRWFSRKRGDKTLEPGHSKEIGVDSDT